MKKPFQTVLDPEYSSFAAIDFETADNGRDSACALAVVRVERGAIVRTWHALIRPPRRNILFTYIHGIEWRHVADKPAFGGYWDEIATILDGVDFIAAHNAGFDRAVLRECCLGAGVPPPSLPFCCTVRLARKAWELRPASLDNVCRVLGIPLNHHQAESDAAACAAIVLRAMKEQRPFPNFLKERR